MYILDEALDVIKLFLSNELKTKLIINNLFHILPQIPVKISFIVAEMPGLSVHSG